MRDDRLRIADILEACALVLSFVSQKNRSDLGKDRLLQSGVLHQLYVIGEAANRISTELKARYPSVPWQVLYGFRNYIAHEYFSLDLDIVWQTVIRDIPELQRLVREISEREFP
jgi:uncharacterized protein with HEPN domain